jgi:hypothetical protein
VPIHHIAKLVVAAPTEGHRGGAPLSRPKRIQPADPQAINYEAALRRGASAQAKRHASATPAVWGVSPQLRALPSQKTVQLDVRHGQVLAARRSDAFELLKASLGAAKYAASQRYLKDGLIRAGVNTSRETWRPTPIDDDAGRPGYSVSQAVIDAGGRIEAVHARIGRLDLVLLRVLAAATLTGEVRPWRWLVEQETGVADRHGQGAVVCHVCENLRLAYAEIDKEEARRRRESAPVLLRPAI